MMICLALLGAQAFTATIQHRSPDMRNENSGTQVARPLRQDPKPHADSPDGHTSASTCCFPSVTAPTCLTELRIKDFALVAEDTVHFSPGLNVITGESGSGKSVLVRPG